jgi:hypothetical protein
LSEWFWNGSIHPYYYCCYLCFCIPHVQNFYYEVFYFKISASVMIRFFPPGTASSFNPLMPELNPSHGGSLQSLFTGDFKF